jgi:polyhydroxyalkanoate synthesis repressor PhaR
MQQRLRLQCNVSAGTVAAVPTILIKKYGNRRLYDTGDSRYITLEELAVKIRGGADVRIVDAQNNEDLTQATLTQIVLETGNAAKFLPVQLLVQMIRLSDDALAEFFSRYVTSALDLYLQAKRGMQTLSSFNPLTQIPGAATDALARMWMASPFGSPFQQQPLAAYSPPPPPQQPPQHFHAASPEDDGEPTATAPAGGSRGDVAAMRRELDELKQAIRDGFAGRGKKKKKS